MKADIGFLVIGINDAPCTGFIKLAIVHLNVPQLQTWLLYN